MTSRLGVSGTGKETDEESLQKQETGKTDACKRRAEYDCALLLKIKK